MTVRAYAALLRWLLPTGFNDAFAAELRDVFAELDRRAREAAPPWARQLAAWRALVAEVPGLIRLAIRERQTHHTIRARQPTARLEDNMFDSLIQDIAFAFRALRRAPGFAAVAILTLALGVGANTAMFSVVDSVLLTPLHLREPDRLLAIGEQHTGSSPTSVGVTSPANLYDWQAHSTTVRIAGFSGTEAVLTGHGEPEQLSGTTSIGGLLDIVDVRPLFGRTITAADEAVGAAPTVVLSYDAWQRIFGDDLSILGKTIDLNGIPRTIVGVMPQRFSYPSAPNDFWLPARLDAAARANRDQYYIQVIGRLAPNATLDQARSELGVIAARLRHDWPTFNNGVRIVALPLQETIVSGVRRQLVVLMGAVAFVLLITCANLANLLLARATARQREIAVRQALGAARGRVVRQLLTESTVLAVLGGALGVLVGRAFLRLLLAAQVTANLPRADEIALDGRVLAFAFGTSLLAGLFFGSVPAWQLSRSNDALRQGTRGSAGNVWSRNVLVVSEVALAMILLTGAGLLLRSFDRLLRVDPGIRTDHTITFSLRLRPPNPDFARASLEGIRALPGVQSAAIVSTLPITGRGIGAWFNRIDRPLPPDVQPTGEAYRVVTPEYFRTVGIPLRAGRLLTTEDRKEIPGVVVNEALVKKYYPDESPLGKTVYLGAPDNRLIDNAPIVGVVGDTRDDGLGSDPLPTVYMPIAAIPTWPFLSYVIRTSGNPAAIMTSTREIIHSMSPNTPIQDVKTLEEVLSTAVAPAKWSTTLLGTFAGVALVMAILGVFGLLSFLVTQRTREVGIRIALGASSSSIQRLVIARGLVLVLAGVGIGLAGAAALTRFLGSLLYGVTPTDPLTFASVTAVLVGSAAVACYLPARRATRVDPIIALRAE